MFQPYGNDSDEEETLFPAVQQTQPPTRTFVSPSLPPVRGFRSRDTPGCSGCSWTGFGLTPRPSHSENCPRGQPMWCEACHQGLDEEPLPHEIWCTSVHEWEDILF